MLLPVNVEEEHKIIKDCVMAAKTVEKLSERAYTFLYQASGFIAHYDRLGFIENYKEEACLKKDIQNNQKMNLWENFHPGDDAYEYYMQKKRIYNTVCDCLKNGIEYKVRRTREKTKELELGW